MYKISEFAKLCNVSRATLIYYDKIGLLSPQITGENGYRNYTIEQHQKYSIIAILI